MNYSHFPEDLTWADLGRFKPSQDYESAYSYVERVHENGVKRRRVREYLLKGVQLLAYVGSYEKDWNDGDLETMTRVDVSELYPATQFLWKDVGWVLKRKTFAGVRFCKVKMRYSNFQKVVPKMEDDDSPPQDPAAPLVGRFRCNDDTNDWLVCEIPDMGYTAIEIFFDPTHSSPEGFDRFIRDVVSRIIDANDLKVSEKSLSFLTQNLQQR